MEFLVHLPKELTPSHIQLLELDAPDQMKRADVDLAKLPPGWIALEMHTRKLGDAWLAAGEAPLLRVPSAILPDTWNILVNPLHPEVPTNVSIVHAKHVPLDERLT